MLGSKELKKKKKELKAIEKQLQKEMRELDKLKRVKEREFSKREKTLQRKEDHLRKIRKKEDLKRRKRKLFKTTSWTKEVNKEYLKRYNPIRLIKSSKSFKHYQIYNFNSKTIENFFHFIEKKVLSILRVQNKVIYTLVLTFYKISDENKEIIHEHFINKHAFVILTVQDKKKSFSL